MFITDMSIYNNYKNVHTKNNDKHTFISHKKTHSVKKQNNAKTHTYTNH